MGFFKTGARDERQPTGRELPRGSWLQAVFIATLLGAIIEITSKLGGFYAFDPPAGVFAIVFGGFGLVLGSLAHAMRTAHPLAKLLAGWAVAGLAEAANAAGLIPGLSWTFAPGWPLGIESPAWRSVALGAVGGGFILAVGAIDKRYRRR